MRQQGSKGFPHMLRAGAWRRINRRIGAKLEPAHNVPPDDRALVVRPYGAFRRWSVPQSTTLRSFTFTSPFWVLKLGARPFDWETPLMRWSPLS